jgi:hypothetical protein
VKLSELRKGQRFYIKGKYFQVSGKLIDKSGGSAVVIYDGETSRIQRGPGAIMWWVCNDTQSVGRPCPLCWN